MALQAALSAGNLTAIRSDNYRVLQFVCVVPNTLVVQFQPAADAADNFAEISVTTVASGSMSNVKVGQLVIFSSSSDYQATETFRTRVRKLVGGETSLLYVGENSQALTTADYVTVIDTYEVQEKLRKSQTKLDWDLTFRKLLPIETALASAYVLSNGTLTWSETASPRVMDADATSISTHAWSSSNSNDTLDSGGTTATPSFTLEAGAFRWLRYTFTDDLGQSNYRVIPVWTVPKNYSGAVQLGFGSESGDMANISFDDELGWTCTIPAFTGITTLLNKTLTVVACDEWYNDTRQNIRTNINFVGYLQNESVNTATNEIAGVISETAFTIEGFGHQMARQNITSAFIQRTVASASAWDEIKNPTPARMIAYRITEFSTLSNLCALSIPADDTSFVGDDLVLDSEKLLDDIRFIAEVINAELQFDVDGKLDLCRDLTYLSTATRNAAATVVTLSPDDFVGQYNIDYDYSTTTAQVDMAGGSYDSTNDVYDIFEALAPITRYSNGEIIQISNQVLTTNNTAAQSQTEIAQRASNFLASNNPTWTLRVQLKDEWHFLVPDNGVWFKFDIVATDTVRGKVFDSTDRWQLVAISHTSNSLNGTRSVNAVFRHETESTGASVRANPVVQSENADIDYYPATLAPFSGADNSLTNGKHYDSVDVSYPSEDNPPDSNCETLGFRVTGSGADSSPALNGEEVAITVRGSGRIAGGSGQLDSFSVNATSSGYTAGAVNTVNGEPYTVNVAGSWTYNNDNDVVDAQWSSPTTSFADRNRQNLIQFQNGADIPAAIDPSYNDGHSYDFLRTGNGSPMSLRFKDTAYSDNGGSFTVTVNNATVLGDAFYYSTDNGETWKAYGSGQGLLVEGSQPASIPPFNPEHEYTIYATVTSGPVSFSFNNPYSSSQAENWSISIIICFLGVP